MRSVGLKVLKNKLSEYVRLAAGGETVLVTDRNRVVAEIGPPRTEKPSTEEFFAKGAREGWLTLPKKSGDLPPPPKAVVSLKQLLDDLARDREDR
jgi:antitoxin (DNA-binding transcriptional repressor) of toxin-antitoxin stability system